MNWNVGCTPSGATLPARRRHVRHGLGRDLGFTEADRVENIRRVTEVARLMADAGLIVLASFISPFRAERDAARELIGTDRFCEVFVDTPIEVAESAIPRALSEGATWGARQLHRRRFALRDAHLTGRPDRHHRADPGTCGRPHRRGPPRTRRHLLIRPDPANHTRGAFPVPTETKYVGDRFVRQASRQSRCRRTGGVVRDRRGPA